MAYHHSNLGSQLGNVRGGDSQNLVSVGSGVISHLVGLASLPVVVEVSEPLVDFKVMKSNVGDNLLLNDRTVSSISDSVLEAQVVEFGISVKAVLHGLGDLVSEALNQVDDLNKIRNGALRGLFEDFTNENDNLVSSSIINAGHDGGRVGELVFLKESIQRLLEGFFVSKVRLANHSQNLVSVGSGVISHLVGLASLPVVVEISEPLVDLQIVEGNESNDLLLNDRGVSIVVNSVLEAQSFEFFVSVKAVLHGLRDLISKAFNQVDKLNQISNRAFCGLSEDFTNENIDFVSSGFINAGHDGGGSRELVFFKQAVQGLLEDFLVSGGLYDQNDGQNSQQLSHQNKYIKGCEHDFISMDPKELICGLQLPQNNMIRVTSIKRRQQLEKVRFFEIFFRQKYHHIYKTYHNSYQFFNMHIVKPIVLWGNIQKMFETLIFQKL